MTFIGFGHHTTNYAVFGMGMLLIGYLTAAFVFLTLNTLTYCNLGHTGTYFRRYGEPDAIEVSAESAHDAKGYLSVLATDADANTGAAEV